MLQQRWLVVTSAIVACILQAHCADKYTDENRPYEFGFNIEGEQHRHEKKDENGLIMGEFGFITADGVYHVTVYATDENGNFKILSMKNIRTKPFPTAPERKGHSIPFPPSQNPPPAQGPSPQKPLNPIPGPVQAAPAKSCSHCSLPTTTTQKPLLTDIALVSKDQGSQNDGSLSTHEQNPQGAQNNQGPPHNYPGQNINGGSVHQVPQGQNYPSQPVYSSAEGNSQIDPSVPSVSVGSEQGQNNPDPSNYPQLGPNPPPITGGSQPGKNYPFPGGVSQFDDPNTGLNYPQQNLGGVQENYNVISTPGQTLQAPLSNSGERSPKQFTDYPQQPVVGPVSQNNPQGNLGDNGPQDNINARPNKPTLISAQMQIVDKNTDINHKNPGEKDGLPNGLTKDDMVRLLYTFNYTVGFHGHFEEGYTNGAKQGYYFVTGRNGVRTRVDYVADEKGFRPKITEEVLDLLSDEVPKPETEKDEKYGLKGYEFKWLYYPVESRKR